MSLLLVHRLDEPAFFVSSNTVFGHPCLHLSPPQFLSHSLGPWGPFSRSSDLYATVPLSNGLACCACVQFCHAVAILWQSREKKERKKNGDLSHTFRPSESFFFYSSGYRDGFWIPCKRMRVASLLRILPGRGEVEKGKKGDSLPNPLSS